MKISFRSKTHKHECIKEIFFQLYLMIVFIMCTYRYRGRSRSDGYACRKCSESHAERKGNRACRGMCQYKDSYCFWYEAALGASSAVVSILVSLCMST